MDTRWDKMGKEILMGIKQRNDFDHLFKNEKITT